jgi:starch synthase
VAYKTGGLADTIEDPGDYAEKLFCEKIYGRIKETGFLFRKYASDAFIREIKQALCVYHNKEIWLKLIRNAMGRDFSWKKSVETYIQLYSKLLD